MSQSYPYRWSEVWASQKLVIIFLKSVLKIPITSSIENYIPLNMIIKFWTKSQIKFIYLKKWKNKPCLSSNSASFILWFSSLSTSKSFFKDSNFEVVNLCLSISVSLSFCSVSKFFSRVAIFSLRFFSSSQSWNYRYKTYGM